MTLPFRDRHDAGRVLAAGLNQYADRSDVVVFGLPRGGVVVAYEVATALNLPLDAFVVRKLGVPGHEEFAFGAIATGGLRVINDEVVRELHLSSDAIDAVEARERRELARRERLYRGSRPLPELRGLTVLLVDDGLATGSTMRAAASAIRQLGPAWIVGAVPVAASDVCRAMLGAVDEMICTETPEPFHAVGVWYDEFSSTPDRDVCDLLRRAEGLTTRRPEGFVASTDVAIQTIRDNALSLTGSPNDWDPLLDRVGDASLVLLGEASHGTAEFYRARAQITRKLIEERGFSGVIVEADWPDAYRVNRFVRGNGKDADSLSALGDFRRFPRWMWRNTEMLDFVTWLRKHNDQLPAAVPGVGFYGMDLYSLTASTDAVIRYLQKVDPAGAERARARYACFDQFGDDPQAYGAATELGSAESCENEAVGQLVELQRRATELAKHDGRAAEDEYFFAEQNARLAKNAEAYYRAMFRGRISSWNLRDRHMAETLESLLSHLRKQHSPAKLVVWAHNSHLGDARATELHAAGEFNLGQLIRERHGRDAVLVGFSTFEGTVTAARDWDGPARRRRVRPGLPGSYEELFHSSGVGNALLLLSPATGGFPALREPRLQRAIGVVYRPETERFSHYLDVSLADQFDAIIHFDRTTAVEPLDRDPGWETEDELPDTYPFGI